MKHNRKTPDFVIRLPPPSSRGRISVEEAISRRKSVRRYEESALTLEQLSQILWSAQGITHGKFRAVPSAGATYPLEIMVVAGQQTVVGLNAGIYHYDPNSHSLTMEKASDIRQHLSGAALGQQCVANAPAVLVACAIFSRTAFRYGTRAQRYVNIEVGHIGQDVHLQAITLGLGAVMVGAFDDETVRELLGLDETVRPLYIMPVGRPAGE
ncbi:MAG: SagB/ThcOx family dehydrogenase [Chloroflexota bacterium]